jgi:hypothetical protein
MDQAFQLAPASIAQVGISVVGIASVIVALIGCSLKLPLPPGCRVGFSPPRPTPGQRDMNDSRQ